MVVSDVQRARVRWLLECRLVDEDWEEVEFSAKWERLFAEMESSEELFLYAYYASGDLTAAEWRRLIDHPMCDRGAALLIFWRNSPGYLYQYGSAAQVPHDDGRYDLVKDVERRYLAGEYADRGLRFDPARFRGCNLLLSYPEGRGVERIPLELRRPSPGQATPML